MVDHRFARLTPRERECLKAVRDLKSSDTIARDLGIASGTVDSYLRDATAKLGARDRRHAALLYADYLAGSAPNFSGSETLGIAPPADQHSSSAHTLDDIRVALNDVVRDEWRPDVPSGERLDLRLFVREILDGTRPDEMTMATRAMLTLAAAVAIGFCFLALSASAGMLFGIADLLRHLASSLPA